MGEVGINISRHYSKHVAEFQGRHFHCAVRSVITPTHRARKIPEGDVQLHWSFDDLAAAQGSDPERLQIFRRVRDEIAEQVRKWLRTADQSSDSRSKSLP